MNANRISKGKQNVHKVPLYLASLNQSPYDQINEQLNAAAEANSRDEHIIKVVEPLRF